mgnify:CR=1 FL=1
MQQVVDTLAEYEEINNKFGLPEYYEDPEKMDALFARQAELQDIIDATDAWNLDTKLERAMDALRLSAGRSTGKKSFWRRTPSGCFMPFAVAEAGYLIVG